MEIPLNYNVIKIMNENYLSIGLKIKEGMILVCIMIFLRT